MANISKAAMHSFFIAIPACFMGEPYRSVEQPEKGTNYILISVGAAVVLFGLFLLSRGLLKTEEKIVSAKNLTWDDVAFVDEDGVPRLKEWRILALNKQTEALENSEQYVLLALEDGFYDCYHCGSPTCYLQKGMVWKYGVTRRGVAGRYAASWLLNMNLGYQIQFEGSYQECLAQEKSKIILYPLHPDNMTRKTIERMARPPGNKNDN